MPSRPCPRIVRGRTMVTSSPRSDLGGDEALGLELRRAVGLARARLGRAGHRVLARARRRRRSTRPRTVFFTPAAARGLEEVLGAVDVDAPEEVLVLGDRDLGDVVVDDVDPLAGAARSRPRRGCRRGRSATSRIAVGDVDEIEDR